MLIGGLQKLSLIDFPGKLAAVVFTRGCPFKCQFCHNSSLVLPPLYKTLIPEEEVFHFLKKRQNYLTGVVISGGEPTIQKELPSFISKIKKLGYQVKLDTSGSCPDMLEELLQKDLLDYIAMDIKAPLNKYEQITGVKIEAQLLLKSISLIMQSKITKEFRSTLVQGLHNNADILEMAQLIKGAPLYSLQKYVNANPLNPFLKSKEAFELTELLKLQKEIEKTVQNCLIK